MDLASTTSSLKWWDYILAKVVTETSETRHSLDQYGVDYMMDLYEMISLKEYMESLRQFDQITKLENEKMLQHLSKLSK